MGRISPILADTITPVMFANVTYLFVLNALIGILEGILLRRLFYGSRRAVWWMIPANYFSAWVGLIAIGYFAGPYSKALLGDRPIERINRVAVLLAVAAYAASVILEAGFVWLAIERSKRTLARVAKASLFVNAASYVLISGWFVAWCFSLPVYVSVVQRSELGLVPAGTLYWVDPAGQVLACDLNTTQSAHKVGAVVQNDFMSPYQLRVERADRPDRVKLTVQYSMISYPDRRPPDNLEDPDPLVLSDLGPVGVFPQDYWQQSRMLRMNVLDLRPTDRRQMRVSFNWYSHELVTSIQGGLRCRLCIGDWEIEEPVILPDDKIVFEWGGQIVLFDPHNRKLAYVAAGTCPAFVPDSQ